MSDSALERQAEPQQEWIPVSERLPEDGEWAIFTDGKSISVERYKLDAIDHFFPNGRWFELEDAAAWIPLPKPYESNMKPTTFCPNCGAKMAESEGKHG